MATINGTWVFNLVLSKPNFEFYQSGVNFGIDGLSEPVAAIIYYLETNGAYTGNRLWYRGGVDGFPDGDINMVYNFDTNTWTDTKFRTISFYGYEELGEEFAAWFTANATKQTEEEKPKPKIATFDLSKLNLETGTHTIQVRSRRENYFPSPLSNSLSYTYLKQT